MLPFGDTSFNGGQPSAKPRIPLVYSPVLTRFDQDGDGDFDMLLTHVKYQYGVKTVVYGVANLTANSLINAADSYHKIEPSLLL